MLGRELNAQALNSAAEVETPSVVTGTIVGNIQPLTSSFTGGTQVVTTVVSLAFPVQVIAASDATGTIVGNIQPLTSTFSGTSEAVETIVSEAFPVQVTSIAVTGTVVGNIQPLTSVFSGTSSSVVTIVSEAFPVQVLNVVSGAIIGNILPITSVISGSTDKTVVGVIGITLSDVAGSGDTNQVIGGTLDLKLSGSSSALTSAQSMANNLTISMDTVATRIKLEGILGALPVTDLMYFNSVLSGRLSSALMEIYNRIVENSVYGVKNLIEEGILANPLNGRFLWQVTFLDGTKIAEENHAAFTFAFAEAVTEGKRLPGNDDIQREDYLLKSMPLVLNPTWRVPFKI